MLYETMILISVKDYNQFSQDYYDSVISDLSFNQLSCSCGRSSCLSIHGRYTRGIFLPDGEASLCILRVRCSECGRTHAVLPSSLVPYDRISLADQLTVVTAYESGTDRNAICDVNPSVDENCVKAIIRRYVLFWLQRLLSEAICLTSISSLILGCFSSYSMQFMQIRRTPDTLFVPPT